MNLTHVRLTSQIITPNNNVYVSPLINKTADEVLRLIKTYCYTYGLPRNGKDLKNKKKTFCNKNGSPHSPTPQGLVEKAKKSLKEEIRTLIVSTNRETNTWRQSSMEAAYVGNIAYHHATKLSPWEAVYGVKSHSKQVTPSLSLDPRLKLKLKLLLIMAQ